MWEDDAGVGRKTILTCTNSGRNNGRRGSRRAPLSTMLSNAASADSMAVNMASAPANLTRHHPCTAGSDSDICNRRWFTRVNFIFVRKRRMSRTDTQSQNWFRVVCVSESTCEREAISTYTVPPIYS
ncbi:hypothetical protein J6590_020269 [Homalodisca vitripennis]|nr:hypothetical protein J6590_020269 [Homalodisca vitripennis]